MVGFDGVYLSSEFGWLLSVIRSALSEDESVAVSFRPSGYTTEIEYRFGTTRILAETRADWARGYAFQTLTAQQITDLMAELERHHPKVWIHVDPDGSITCAQPTEP
jgi:hypothetical protein